MTLSEKTQTQYIAKDRGRLDAVVRSAFSLSHGKARGAITSGKITVDGERVIDIGARVKVGQAISLNWNAPNPSRSEPLGVKLVYRDSSILVIDKPAGLLSTPTGASERETAVTAARRLCKSGQPPVVVRGRGAVTGLCGSHLFGEGVEVR